MRNKRIIAAVSLALVTAIVITGCTEKDPELDTHKPPVEAVQNKGNDTPPSEPKDEQEAQNDEKEVAAAFQKLAASAEEAHELIAYLDQHISLVGKPIADGMIEELEAFYRAERERMNEAFMQREVERVFSEAGYFEQASKVKDHITDPTVLALIETVEAGKYKLETSEGIYYPVVDYAALHEAYGQYLSEEWNSYLRLMELESEQPSMADAAIIVSWAELVTRALQAEVFLAEYPESQRADEAKGLLWRYMSGYFFGSDNTDTYDANMMVKEIVMESYRETVAMYPESLIGQMTVKYMQVLDEIGGKLDWSNKETAKKLNQFRGELDKHFE